MKLETERLILYQNSVKIQRLFKKWIGNGVLKVRCFIKN